MRFRVMDVCFRVPKARFRPLEARCRAVRLGHGTWVTCRQPFAMRHQIEAARLRAMMAGDRTWAESHAFLEIRPSRNHADERMKPHAKGAADAKQSRECRVPGSAPDSDRSQEAGGCKNPHALATLAVFA